MEPLNFERLRAKIAEGRKVLDEQERALDLVEAMSRVSDLVQPTLPGVSNSEEPILRRGITWITKPSGQRVQRIVRPPQKELLKRAIDKLGNVEFTVNMVNDVLVESGNKFDGEKPQNRIAVLLSILVEEGYVKLTQQGGGNVPKKYTKVDQEEENPLL